MGAFLSFVLGFGLFASVFIIPIFTQRILGFTAQQTGFMLLPGAVASGLMMPFIGKALQAGVKQTRMIPVGFFLFFVFTTWVSFQISPTAGESDFFWPLMLRGVAMGLIFLPITTMSISGLRGKDAAQAAGLTSMLRQLGGSFGVALIGTFIERTDAHRRADLASNLSLWDPETTERLRLYAANFAQKEFSAVQAQQQAYKAFDFALMKQAALLTYAQTFQLLGGFFLICIPLIFFIRLKRATPGAKVDMAAH